MEIKDNYKIFEKLSRKFDFLIYEGHSVEEDENRLLVTYHFNLANKYSFYPTLEFIKGKFYTDNISETLKENFIFHIGLIELISYWKAACPPNIIIKPYKLDDDQITWWKNLWFNGLGEFFYLNNIKPDPIDFVTVKCESEKTTQLSEMILEREKVLIPVGGGKDSAVTLELLKPHFTCIPFVINPGKASLDCMMAAEIQSDGFIEVKRTIHPQLLKLNKQGFLNGHTPFSAMLAFVSSFVAAMCGIRSIALSNESSANEPTDIEAGINHQYSKSFAFENNFRDYLDTYISKEINYFSFLRPINEYSIASLFSKFNAYFKVFNSCNVGSKTDTWCCSCPKCLFTFIILSPHISMKKILEIFGKDLLDDKNLLDHFNELTGISETKPFDCVGTIDEVNFSLIRIIEKRGENLPTLLKYYISTPYFYRYRDFTREEITQVEKKEHFLEDDFMKILKRAMHA
jgi:UDP-N-acetyl-alpha-D-muramoyl-L-alanyl-L-glutamate epimerase